MPTKKEIEDIVNFSVMNKDDLVFTHSIFVQCFLPVRSLPKGQDFYKVSHGNLSFAIEAGNLINPTNLDIREKREIPAGSKARLLFAYINSNAIQTKSPLVDMGSSLREFMKRNGIPVGGANAKEITRQTKNIAAAEIVIGSRNDIKVAQDQIRVVRGLSFWVDKLEQGTVWEPVMRLSDDYMRALNNYRVPLDFRALVGLQANPRAMDLYCWLSYRLRTIKPKSPVKIPYSALHPVFGQGINQLKHFKIHFKKAVLEAHKFYPTARIEINEKDYIVLKNSPSPIPHKVSIGYGKALIPRK